MGSGSDDCPSPAGGSEPGLGATAWGETKKLGFSFRRKGLNAFSRAQEGTKWIEIWACGPGA